MTVGVHLQYNNQSDTVLLEVHTVVSTDFIDWCSFNNQYLLALQSLGGTPNLGTVYFYEYATGKEINLFSVPGFYTDTTYSAQGITWNRTHIFILAKNIDIPGFPDYIFVLDINGNILKAIELTGYSNELIRITCDKNYLYCVQNTTAKAKNIVVYNQSDEGVTSPVRTFSLTAGLNYLGADFDGEKLILLVSGNPGRIELWDLTGNKTNSKSIGSSDITTKNGIAWNKYYNILRVDETIAPIDID